MFGTFKQRLLLGIYIFIVLSIPVGAYLVSQSKTIKSSASEQKNTKAIPKVTPKPATSSAKELLSASKGTSNSKPSPSPESPTIATSFGPTLSFAAILEGRPEGNFVTRLFVGILEGNLTTNPKFLLNFTVDLPAGGRYSNLSLAGLNPGSKYTALLKGSAQIATSSSFIMSPSETRLNDLQPLTLLSGDLNEDNVINSADYSIAQKAAGATTKSQNWNEIADLNKDGLINVFDLAIIAKNIGQVGASGAWTSPIPKISSPSASLNNSSSVGSPAPRSPQGEVGYWIWIPK